MRRSPPRAQERYDRNRRDDRSDRGREEVRGDDRGGRYRNDRMPQPDAKPERRSRSEDRFRNSLAAPYRQPSRERSREPRRVQERDRGFDRRNTEDARGAFPRSDYRSELPPNSNNLSRVRDRSRDGCTLPPSARSDIPAARNESLRPRERSRDGRPAPPRPSFSSFPIDRNASGVPSMRTSDHNRSRDVIAKLDPRDMDLQKLIGERSGHSRPVSSAPLRGGRGGGRSRGTAPPPRSKLNAESLDAAMDDYWKQEDDETKQPQVENNTRDAASGHTEQRTLSVDSAVNGEPPPPGLEDDANRRND